MQIEAQNVQAGDKIDGHEVSDVRTGEIVHRIDGPATKTLVTLSSDGYAWQKCLNPTELVEVVRAHHSGLLDITPQTEVAGRPLAEYVQLHHHAGQVHSTDGIVGYVVRETVRDGKALYSDDRAGCGYDVQAVEGGHRYGDTFGLRDFLREGRGYAVVDSLYACGCRSGLPIPQPHVASGGVA